MPAPMNARVLGRRRAEVAPARVGPWPVLSLAVWVCGLLLVSTSAFAQVLALPVGPSLQTFSGEGDIKTVTISLANVPNRPALRVEIIPDAEHPDLETEIVIKNFGATPWSAPGFCHDPPSQTFEFSSVGIGEHALQHDLYECEPRLVQPGGTVFYDDKTVDVEIRVTDFGANGAPADAWVTIRGITVVPWNAFAVELEDDLTPQFVSLYASKDTVVYDSNDTTSNGAGQRLWAGTDYTVIFLGGTTLRFHDELNSLIAFDVGENTPFNSTISNATLFLHANEIVGSGGGVGVYAVSDSGIPGVSWGEGSGNASGNEFVGVDGGPNAANWDFRQGASFPWIQSGGDTTGGLLATTTVTSIGWKTWNGAAIDAEVQAMADTDEDENGFLVVGPGSFFDFFDRAVSFHSDQTVSFGLEPRLNYTATPNGPWIEGLQFDSGTEFFISEGQNFRWLYDADDDGIFVTSIGGVCEEDADPVPHSVPYTYAYSGNPFVGIDCCTWRVESAETGTVGTGQALFYHGLDPSDPANAPPDTDGDAIQDGCDNCPLVPNGPLRGVCSGPSGISTTCLSDGECGAGEICDLYQADADLDGTGDACAVPEPGSAVSLFSGVLLLVAARARRRS